MLGTLIAAFISGETGLMIERTKKAVAAYLLAALLSLVAIVFLLVALYVYAERELGPIWGALAIAGVFIVLALAIIIAHTAEARARQRRIERKRQRDMVSLGSTAAVAILPSLLRSKKGLAFLAMPAAALASYLIYNNRRESDEPD